jgi:hypothetical protein
MKKKLILKLADLYYAELLKRHSIPKKIDEHTYMDGYGGDRMALENHLAWACQYIKTLVAEHGTDGVSMAQQWLGFVQGALWATGIFTIEEMRQHDIGEMAKLEEEG